MRASSAEFAAVMAKAGNIRRLGSAALDLCFVAAGNYDGFWERDLKAWDIAAGIVIVQRGGRLRHRRRRRRRHAGKRLDLRRQ